jgi:tRNA 2-thiouridine synthesizing protein C
MDKSPELLIIQTHAPYASSHAQEALDLVLAAAAFDASVAYLLIGDACFQLLPNQAPEQVGRKALHKMMKALPVYGVEQILVAQEDLTARGITTIDPALSVQPISPAEITRLIRTSRNVIRF